MTVNEPNLLKVVWRDIKSEVKLVNPELAQLIEEFEPSDEYCFYKAKYHYGSHIVNRGLLHLPTAEDKVLPLEHASFSIDLKNNLNYSSVPLGLILKNGNEVYYEKDNNVISVNYFEPGIIFGLWETLEPQQSHFQRKIWRVSAGARSLFMLPKIADAQAHERLKREYNLRSLTPRHLYDHAKIFSEITKRGDWRHEVVYFSKKWVDKSNKKWWIIFRRYLLEKAWELSSYNRNEATRTIVWGLFSNYLSKKRIKFKPYLLNVLKYLISTSLGGVPGYKPTGKSELAGPIKEIQKAYLEVYNIAYVPVIMQPAHYKCDKNPNSIYTSLNLPYAFDQMGEIQKNNTLLKDLRLVKMLWEFFIEAAIDGQLFIDDTPMQNIINNVKLEFFHNEKDSYGEIELSSNIPASDPDMLDVFASPKKKEFPSASQFFRGSIRISRIV